MRGSDEDSLSDLGAPSPFRTEPVWRKDGGGRRNVIPLLPKRLNDDLPLVGVAWSGKVPNVLEKKHRGVTLLNDLEDVEVERAPNLIQHPRLSAGLREGLARKPRSKDVVRLDLVGNAVVASVNRDVTESVDAPVLLVDTSGILVDLDCVGAPAAHPREHSVEAPDTGKQVHVAEGGSRHGPSLAAWMRRADWMAQNHRRSLNCY